MSTAQGFTMNNPDYLDRPLSLDNATYIRRSLTGEPMYMVNNATFSPHDEQPPAAVNEPLVSLIESLDFNRKQNLQSDVVSQPKKELTSEFKAAPKTPPQRNVSKPSSPPPKKEPKNDEDWFEEDEFDTDEIIRSYLRDASQPQDTSRAVTLGLLIAGALFFCGLVFSINGLRTNHATVQAEALTGNHGQSVK